jgi:ribosome-associated protein
MSVDSRKIADAAVECAFDKKGENIVVLDMKEITQVCDYFVIVSGTSRPNTRAICDCIEEKFSKELCLKYKKIQGKEEGGWILMDYGTVVIHIFLDNLRSYYNLEGLWQKAKAEHPVPPMPQTAEAG